MRTAASAAMARPMSAQAAADRGSQSAADLRNLAMRTAPRAKPEAVGAPGPAGMGKATRCMTVTGFGFRRRLPVLAAWLSAALGRWWPKLVARWPLILVSAGAGLLALRNLAGVVHFALHRAGEGDFALYYIFARIGLRHGFGALYDLAAQRQEWLSLGSKFFYPAIFTPPVAWLVAPFAVFPFPVAYSLWNALLGLATLITWWLLAPGKGLNRLAHLAVALALPLVAFGLLLGQVVILVAAAVALSWWLLRRGRPLLAGLALSLIALKPQLAFLVPLALLVTGQWRLFAGWLSGSAAMLLVALLTLGPANLHVYLLRLLATGKSLDASLVPVQLTVSGLLGNGAAALIAQAVIAGLLLWLCRRRRSPEFAIAAGLCGSVLITPYLHAQDLGVLLASAWLYLRTEPAVAERIPVIVGYLAAGLLATPLPLLITVGGWTATTLSPGQLRLSAIPRPANVRSGRS